MDWQYFKRWGSLEQNIQLPLVFEKEFLEIEMDFNDI